MGSGGIAGSVASHMHVGESGGRVAMQTAPRLPPLSMSALTLR